MTQHNQIQIAPRRELTPGLVSMILSIAPTIHQSRIYTWLGSAEQAATIMMTGVSYGFDPITSFRAIHMIENKPSIAPAAALGLVQSSGLLEAMTIEDISDAAGNPWACKVTMKRRGIEPYAVTVTMADARNAGLTEGSLKADGKPRGRGGYEKWGANMLRWRAIGFVEDVLFADIMHNLKRWDEMGGEITPDGDFYEAEREVIDVQPNA